MGVAPLRVVSLLDVPATQRSNVQSLMELDILRTESDDDWWRVITALIEVSTVIIIDADAETPGVIREFLHIIANHYEYKTIFLTVSNAPLLSRARPKELNGRSLCVADARVVNRILISLLSRGIRPAVDVPVVSFKQT